MTHRGIRIRVSNAAGVLLEADSQTLHDTAILSGAGDTWVDLLQAYSGDPAGLTVEIRPVTLDDPPGDLDEDNPLGFGDCECPCSGCSGCVG